MSISHARGQVRWLITFSLTSDCFLHIAYDSPSFNRLLVHRKVHDCHFPGERRCRWTGCHESKRAAKVQHCEVSTTWTEIGRYFVHGSLDVMRSFRMAKYLDSPPWKLGMLTTQYLIRLPLLGDR